MTKTKGQKDRNQAEGELHVVVHINPSGYANVERAGNYCGNIYPDLHQAQFAAEWVREELEERYAPEERAENLGEVKVFRLEPAGR